MAVHDHHPGAAELDAALRIVDLEMLRRSYTELSQFVDDFTNPAFLRKELDDFSVLAGILPHVVADAGEFPDGLDSVLQANGLDCADSFHAGFAACLLLFADYIGRPDDVIDTEPVDNDDDGFGSVAGII